MYTGDLQFIVVAVYTPDNALNPVHHLTKKDL
jgi:hypothetical protein